MYNYAGKSTIAAARRSKCLFRGREDTVLLPHISQHHSLKCLFHPKHFKVKSFGREPATLIIKQDLLVMVHLPLFHLNSPKTWHGSNTTLQPYSASTSSTCHNSCSAPPYRADI